MKIEVTLEELNTILSGLGELPAKASFALIGNLHKQAQEQLPKEDAPKVEEPKAE
jgi:hypothetical protein